MIDAITTFVGCASLIRRIRGTHHSSGLSEMSSQFHEPCSAAPGRFFIDTLLSSGVVRKNFVRAPKTLTTGWRPMVFTTTPPQPASNARMMFDSDSVGGAEERRKGLSNLMPVNVMLRAMSSSASAASGGSAAAPLVVSAFTTADPSPREARRRMTGLRHPIHSRFPVPLRRHLLRLRPELDRSTPGNVADAEFRLVPPTERERLARHRHADVH